MRKATMIAGARPLTGEVARLLAALWRGFTLWRGRARDAHHLAALDDTHLADIGIAREDIARAVREGRPR